MYELSVERTFCAAHAITIAGRREPVHGHNWKAIVTVSGDHLNDDGLLCDFHVIEKALDEVIQPMHNADLNRLAPFERVNPTAEHVARHIAEAIAPALPRRAALRSVRVAEAPGCTATYTPEPS